MKSILTETIMRLNYNHVIKELTHSRTLIQCYEVTLTLNPISPL